MSNQSIRRYFRQKQQKRRGNGKRSYVTELENLQVLCAWRDGHTNGEQAAAVIGIECDDIPALWQEAVEAGKELVK